MEQDTIVVRAPAQGQWGEVVRLVEELRSGVLKGEPEYMFGRVSELAVGRDGSVYVTDGTGPEIRQYDTQGRFVRRIGGSPLTWREPRTFDVYEPGGVFLGPSLSRPRRCCTGGTAMPSGASNAARPTSPTWCAFVSSPRIKPLLSRATPRSGCADSGGVRARCCWEPPGATRRRPPPPAASRRSRARR